MKALSIRQPWAWLITRGWKDVENRRWRTHFRGKFLVHAAKGMSVGEYNEAQAFVRRIDQHMELPPFEFLERGGIVGEAEIVDCVRAFKSHWFVGPYGFVLRNGKCLEFEPCQGALHFFEPKLLALAQRNEAMKEEVCGRIARTRKQLAALERKLQLIESAGGLAKSVAEGVKA